MPENQVFEYTINMKRKENLKFEVDFGSESIPNILLDESPDVPGGEGKGPTASMLLAAAVGNCLSASLTFCLSKKNVELQELNTKIKFKRKRNEDGFWRISEIEVDLIPIVENKDESKFLRCLEYFKQYCVVTKSVEKGIPVQVNIIK